MLDKIIFKGYKSFKEETTLELKPITIIFGKNSSGKSSIAKLPTLIEGALSYEFREPLMYINKGVELGAEFRDVFYKKLLHGEINFSLIKNKNTLNINVINTNDTPIISKYHLNIDDEKSINGVLIKDIKEIQNSEDFKGFLIEGHPYSEFFKLKTNYLGPFRRKPRRIFYINDLINLNKSDNQGDKAYYLLAKYEELEYKVSQWFENNFDGWKLFCERKNSPYYEIKIRRNDSDEGINIADVGQGMSQSLPIIVNTLLDNINEPVLNILEQPELHLHPAAHGDLAELIFNSVSKTNNRYLIETHSKNFIMRLRILIAKNLLNKDDFNLCYIDYDEEKDSSVLTKINVNEKGEVDYWPEHIFNEDFEEALSLRKAQLTKNGI